MKSLTLIIIKICFVYILLSLPVYAYKEKSAQKASLALDYYYTQTWNTHDGLPHNGIDDLIQTEDGYLWIATWEGLARFNGQEFKVFTRGSKVGLPDSAVKSLTLSPNGTLLIAGARGGLSERKNGVWTPQKPTKARVNHAIYDNKENIWLALEGEGLVFRESKTQQDTSIISNLRVYNLVFDEKNILWAATNKGLYSVKHKTLVKHFDQHYGLPNGPVHSVYLTQEKQLIVGTQKGVFKFEKNHFVPLHEQLKSETVISLLQDKKGDLWLGTSNNGLFRLSNGYIEKLDDNKGLPNNRIYSIYEDKESSIWVGTSSGLFRLREAPFITLTVQQGLSGNYIRTVLSHSDGSIWVGSSKGLNKIYNNKISTVKRLNSLNDDETPLSVLSLAEGENTQLLVGTYTQGVFKVIDNQLQPFINKNSGLRSNEVRAMLYDSNQNTWIGTTLGLVKISKNGNLDYFDKTNGLPNNFIMALAEDKNGKIWIATGVGVTTYNKGIIETYRLNEQFDAKYAFGFHIENDAIWMATDRGLLRIDLNTNKIMAVTRKNGLPIDKIFQVLADNEHNFWLTSNRGIIKIKHKEIHNLVSGKSKIIKYDFFAEGIGLLSSQANGASNPAATLHKDGSIWVATAKGVSQVSNERLKKMAEKKLPVVIEKIIADGKSYELFTKRKESRSFPINLPAGTSRIVIHYAGLGFLMSKHIQYQTKLLGFDEYWINKSNQTYSEFTNLPPGNYTFTMRAKYPNGQWPENIAKIAFTIPFYIWQTLWFKLLLVVIIILSFYCIYRCRLYSIQRNEERLEQLITKQTKDLKQQADLFSYQATHDQLTGLSNRRAFDAWCDTDFKQANKNGDSLSLAIIDIDHFKRVNDEHSHLVGDKVIKMLADILQELSSQCPQQVKLARWGGEEFTLLIFGLKDDAFTCCEYIRKSVENYNFSSAAQNLNITISVGLTDNNDVNEYDKMINNADLALYYAKHNGRNQVKTYQKDDAFYHKDRRK